MYFMFSPQETFLEKVDDEDQVCLMKGVWNKYFSIFSNVYFLFYRTSQLFWKWGCTFIYLFFNFIWFIYFIINLEKHFYNLKNENIV